MFAKRGVRIHIVGLLGEHNHHHHRNGNRCRSKAIDRLPAVGLCQRRRNQHRKRRAHIACADQAHGQAFVARRERAGTQRQRYTKAGPGDAQQHAHGKQVVEGLDHENTVEHGHRDEAHLDQGGVLAADVLRQQAQREAHQCARKNRDRQHQAFLRCGELEGLADERCHRAVQNPNAARKTKVQKRREQGGRVARFQETLEAGHVNPRECCCARNWGSFAN